MWECQFETQAFKMVAFMTKICLSLLIIAKVNSQSNCPTHYTVNFTDGPSAELITAIDGVSLLGIRVVWTIKAEYLNCQIHNLRVELNYYRKYITVNDSSADFYNLDCNTQYTPRVIAAISHVVRENTGVSLYYGGRINSAPSPLSRICVGPGYVGKVNISWDHLPCHLQNGADITGYIIEYNSTSSGVLNFFSNSSHALMTCGNEFVGRYGCLFDSSLFTIGVPYTFKVAAMNSYGTGLFSDSVIGMIGIQNNISCIFSNSVSIEDVRDVTTATYISKTSTPSEGAHNNLTTVTVTDIDDNISQLTDIPHCTSQQLEAWIMAGILVVIVIILVGVIFLLITFNYMLWKRLKLLKTQLSQLNESEIDMKECSAYGHVTSTITTSADEQHVYESAK